jgi:hypothetical protein
MSALMLMPLIIKMMVSGKAVHFLMHACLLWIHMAVLDGGMSPLMWIPTIVHAGVAATIPASVPPDPPSYSTKRHRRETNDSWWGHLNGSVRALTDTVFNRVGAVTRLSPKGTSNNKPRTSTYMPARRRRRHELMNRRLAKTLKLVSITCMAASAFEGTTAFDSDSKQVAIDNCSSRSLTTSCKDFVPGTIRKCNVAVSGVGGQIRCKIKGTVCWTFEDDFLLPDTPMCEGLPHRLLSPQHWAQEVEKGTRLPLLGGQRPGCTTNAGSTVLTWGKGKFSKTVPLHPTKNVAIMSTAAGVKKYNAFIAKVEDLEPDICCFAATGAPEPSVTEVTYDEQKGDDEESIQSTDATVKDDIEEKEEGEPPTQVNFQDQPNMKGVSIERDRPLDDDRDELYRLHVRTGHLSFSKL